MTHFSGLVLGSFANFYYWLQWLAYLSHHIKDCPNCLLSDNTVKFKINTHSIIPSFSFLSYIRDKKWCKLFYYISFQVNYFIHLSTIEFYELAWTVIRCPIWPYPITWGQHGERLSITYFSFPSITFPPLNSSLLFCNLSAGVSCALCVAN